MKTKLIAARIGALELKKVEMESLIDSLFLIDILSLDPRSRLQHV